MVMVSPPVTNPTGGPVAVGRGRSRNAWTYPGARSSGSIGAHPLVLLTTRPAMPALLSAVVAAAAATRGLAVKLTLPSALRWTTNAAGRMAGAESGAGRAASRFPE